MCFGFLKMDLSIKRIKSQIKNFKSEENEECGLTQVGKFILI